MRGRTSNADPTLDPSCPGYWGMNRSALIRSRTADQEPVAMTCECQVWSLPPTGYLCGGPFVEPLTQRGDFPPEIEIFIYEFRHPLTTVQNGRVVSTIEECPDLRQ